MLVFSVQPSTSAAQTKATAASTTAAGQNKRGFATSQQAAAALIQAAEQFDVPTLLEIVGPGGADLVVTRDAVQDKQRATTLCGQGG